jgi:hypothetical protein
LVWDEDPDFIEYTYRSATPEAEGPSKKKASMSKKPSGPSTKAKSNTNGTVKLEPAASGSLVSMVSLAKDSGSSVSGLPTFVRASWISSFLPTLYHRFGSSKEPWKMFSKGDEMLSIIQEVVNSVYPDNKYRAKWGDTICSAVLNFLIILATYFNCFLNSR